MFHINIKPQNRNRVFIIFLLGGIWGILDMWRFKGLIPFVIDGGLILIMTVILGNITNYVLDKIGLNSTFKKDLKENILDQESEEPSKVKTEDRKDEAALNYGIVWAIILLLSNLF